VHRLSGTEETDAPGQRYNPRWTGLSDFNRSSEYSFQPAEWGEAFSPLPFANILNGYATSRGGNFSCESSTIDEDDQSSFLEQEHRLRFLKDSQYNQCPAALRKVLLKKTSLSEMSEPVEFSMKQQDLGFWGDLSLVPSQDDISFKGTEAEEALPTGFLREMRLPSLPKKIESKRQGSYTKVGASVRAESPTAADDELPLASSYGSGGNFNSAAGSLAADDAGLRMESYISESHLNCGSWRNVKSTLGVPDALQIIMNGKKKVDDLILGEMELDKSRTGSTDGIRSRTVSKDILEKMSFGSNEGSKKDTSGLESFINEIDMVEKSRGAHIEKIVRQRYLLELFRKYDDDVSDADQAPALSRVEHAFPSKLQTVINS
jgi:hypothetical protein